jgi:hypothetical protein
MSENPTKRVLVHVAGEQHSLETTVPSAYDYAMLEELSFIRREAQAEADQAYGDWRDSSSGETYTVYRAAQDRADAAQDQLASCVRMMA